jgi:hypothetical protein
MENTEKNKLDTKKNWTEPILFSLDIKDTKGGVGPETVESETWEPGSL